MEALGSGVSVAHSLLLEGGRKLGMPAAQKKDVEPKNRQHQSQSRNWSPARTQDREAMAKVSKHKGFIQPLLRSLL